MRHLVMFLMMPVFLISCAYDYAPPQPDMTFSLKNGDYLEIYFGYSSIGCEAKINIRNNSNRSKSIYIELTAYDRDGKNIDSTNFLINNLNSNEIAERSSVFTRVDYCGDIGKISAGSRSY